MGSVLGVCTGVYVHRSVYVVGEARYTGVCYNS